MFHAAATDLALKLRQTYSTKSLQVASTDLALGAVAETGDFGPAVGSCLAFLHYVVGDGFTSVVLGWLPGQGQGLSVDLTGLQWTSGWLGFVWQQNK